ncbi:MAG: hypothetical protein O3A57_11405 [Bacteroidetes bacterium]|nr:hypothetical protein [Bacteroidota bacterium]
MPTTPATHYSLLFLLLVAACSSPETPPSTAFTQGDWPVYGGDANNTHYVTLDQISPENVSQLEVAWMYDTGDAFQGSEMQNNPIVIDGIMYATTPKLKVISLNAATGELLWSFDPNAGNDSSPRFRHRGIVVTGDRVMFNYRNRLYASTVKRACPLKTSVQMVGWICAQD